MSMPCMYYSCPENLHGQCFGGGCSRGGYADPVKRGAECAEDEAEKED